MHKPENKQANDRELAALFAATETPPESDEQFVAGVMSQIRRRERMRWWVLGGSALLASVFGLPAAWELLSAWNGVDASVLYGIGAQLDQAGTLIADFLNTAVRSITFLTAAVLAVTILPLLRWLAD